MELGPDCGRLTLYTRVAGSAARVGHNLTIAVDEWSASVTMDADAPVDVRFTAELPSLRVVSGSGGVTPLTPVDRQLIKRNALKSVQADRFPQVSFTSNGVEMDGSQVAISGELQIHGVTREISSVFSADGSRVSGEVAVLQSDYDVKPYSLMLGQLRVADEVSVVIEVEVQTG